MSEGSNICVRVASATPGGHARVALSAWLRTHFQRGVLARQSQEDKRCRVTARSLPAGPRDSPARWVRSRARAGADRRTSFGTLHPVVVESGEMRFSLLRVEPAPGPRRPRHGEPEPAQVGDEERGLDRTRDAELFRSSDIGASLTLVLDAFAQSAPNVPSRFPSANRATPPALARTHSTGPAAPRART